MAHKKGVGSSDNGRDSRPKYLGVKMFGGEHAIAGNIIVRQRGTRFHPGLNVGIGKDHTLYALIEGTVAFKKSRRDRTFVNILPLVTEVQETVAEMPKEPAKKAAPVKKTVTVAAPEVVNEAPVVEAAAIEDIASDTTETASETLIEEVVETTTTPVAESNEAEDNLKVVEGIGPKIETLLKEGGIRTFRQLADASPESIKEILSAAGARYAVHDPATWPRQAEFAADGKWDELEKWQDEMSGGKE